MFEVQVPMETVVEYKNTVKKTIRRVRVPGYVLVRMDLTDPVSSLRVRTVRRRLLK